MYCPLCGKAGIRLVAFIDASGVLHMIGAGPMPYDSSFGDPNLRSAVIDANLKQLIAFI